MKISVTFHWLSVDFHWTKSWVNSHWNLVKFGWFKFREKNFEISYTLFWFIQHTTRFFHLIEKVFWRAYYQDMRDNQGNENWNLTEGDKNVFFASSEISDENIRHLMSGYYKITKLKLENTVVRIMDFWFTQFLKW